MENQYLSCTKEELSAVIRCFNFLNVSSTEMYSKLTEVDGPHVISRKNV